MSEVDDERPLKATSRTIVMATEINQFISFYYDDPTEIYYSYIKAEMLDELLGTITSNMQNFLTNDILKVNSVHIPLIIIETQLQFNKKKRSEPIIVFSIINESNFRLEEGANIIELKAEPDALDYPITSTWRFPGKVLEVTSPLKYKISGFNIFFEANTLDVIGGEEKFTFFYSRKKK